MNEELFNSYDKIVTFIMTELMENYEEATELGFEAFDLNSREHMTILYIAKYTAELTGRKLGLNIGYFDFLKLRAKHKLLRGIIVPNATPNINVPKLIGKVFMECPDAKVLKIGLGEIYDAYYAPRKAIEND